MIKLPPQGKWSVIDDSDIFGIIQRAVNMQFNEKGYATLAKRARSIYADANFKRPVAMQYDPTNNQYVILTGLSGSEYTINGQTLAVVSGGTLTTSTTGQDDMVPWLVNGSGVSYIYGTVGSNLRRYDPSTTSWSSGLTGTSFSGITNGGPLAVHEGLVYLAIGQSNTVILIDSAHALKLTLTLPAEFKVTSLDYWSGYIVVGTRHVSNGAAKVFLWDGKSTAYNQDYSVDCPRVNSVRKYQNTFVAQVSDGRLLKFNGGGWEKLGAFPVFYKKNAWDLDGDQPLGRVINRGMIVTGDKIYINLSPRLLLPSGDTASHVFENYFPGGIWCYAPDIGLHKRYSHTSSVRTTEAIVTTNVNTTTEVITVASAPDTGTPIIYDNSGGTTLAGLTHRQKYYCIKLTGTTIKLATTAALASAGTAIDLTGTGNNSQLLIYLPNRDFGGSNLGGSTQALDSGNAISLAWNGANAYKSNITEVIFGTRVGTTAASTTVFGIACATFGQENRGHAITVKAFSSTLADMWQNVNVRYSGAKTAEDVIIVKYRLIERTDTLTGIDLGLTQVATWVDGTSFTTTADISAAKIGDEISFHSGTGSGYTAHITNITGSSTYTVTIDETIQNVTAADTVAFVIENWNKLGSITTANNDYFTNSNGDRYMSDSGIASFTKLGKLSKWIELKLELRGEDVRIEDILINNKPFQTFIK